MTEWRRHKNGRGWQFLEDGRIAVEDGVSGLNYRWIRDAGDGVLRTKGEPLTMRTLRAEYGELIEGAADLFEVPDVLIYAMIAVEARKIRKTVSFNPLSPADEDKLSLHRWWERPNRVSAGLMQTLVSTARDMVRKHPEICFDDPDDLDLGHLCVPEISIACGTAYLRDRNDKFDLGWDPVLLCAAYNAGAVYTAGDNPFKLRTYGDARIPKLIAYYNDLLAARES